MLSRSRESPRQSLNTCIRLNSSETRADRITTMTETCLDCKEKVVAFSSCKVLMPKLLLPFFLRDKWCGPSFPKTVNHFGNHKLCPCKQFLLWFHHRFIVVAQIGQRAFITVRTLVHANALSMAQQGLVEIVDAASILWE